MKTIIILLACIACLMGCGNNLSSIYAPHITTVDSCQYVVMNDASGVAITHHTNCKFCRERQEWIYGSPLEWADTASSTMRIPETSDQSLSAPAGSVKLGGTLTKNTTIDKKAWTDASKAKRDTMVITKKECKHDFECITYTVLPPFTECTCKKCGFRKKIKEDEHKTSENPDDIKIELHD